MNQVDTRNDVESMLPLENGLEIWRVHLDALREQDVNARYMETAMFDRLSKTIEQDKRLESLPFVARVGDNLEVVSGHHRTRAARAAGLTHIYCLVDTRGLTRDQIRAKQLAHNAIQGKDDPQLIAKIYSAIEDVEQRLQSFIDPESVGLKVEKIKVENVDLGMEYRTTLLVFMPYELERFEAACKAVEPLLDGDYHEILMAELDRLDRWKQLLRRTGTEYEIKSIGTTIAKIADIVLDALGAEDPEHEPDERVALRDLFGQSYIPREAAEVVQQALERLIRQGDIGPRNRWQALEYLAIEYLNGSDG